MLSVVDDTDAGRIRRSIFVLGLTNFLVWWAQYSISLSGSLFGVFNSKETLFIGSNAVVVGLFIVNFYFCIRWYYISINSTGKLFGKFDERAEQIQKFKEQLMGFERVFGDGQTRKNDLESLQAAMHPIRKACETVLDYISKCEEVGVRATRVNPINFDIEEAKEARDSKERTQEIQVLVNKISPAFDEWLRNRSEAERIIENYQMYPSVADLDGIVKILERGLRADKTERNDRLVSQLPPMIGAILSLVSLIGGPVRSLMV